MYLLAAPQAGGFYDDNKLLSFFMQNACLIRHSRCTPFRSHHGKGFFVELQVLHLLLWKLAGRTPDPTLLKFLRIDELLVDISDDLVDYEDDVQQNSFNIFRCYAHLFGPEAPRVLVQRISDLEQQHAKLLAALPTHLQEHWHTRHREASVEGGSSDGAGAWEFPSIIYGEAAYRESEEDE